MKNLWKLLAIWTVGVGVGALALTFFPNSGPSNVSLAVEAIMFLTGLVCLWVFFKEPGKTNKPIFLNFAVFFLFSIVSFAYKFVGYSILPGNPWAALYVFEFQVMVHFFLLAFAVVYVVIDSLFNEFFAYKKYLLATLIVGGTFAYYYHPYVENPDYLRTTQDILDCKAISSSLKQIHSEGISGPSPEMVASRTDLGFWKDGVQIGSLYDDQKTKRVQELLPYLDGDNVYVLLYKPLYLSNIYVNVLCVVFVFLFFGYQYKNDPPQGAYIEKIIFLFLPYCSLEILHHFAYIKSVEYSTFQDVQQIGFYLTLTNLVLLLSFFSLRLRFITSVKGEFYERELVSDAEHISRWRDAFDNLVVRHFLNPKAVHGRLLAPRAPRGEA
jgi:hypothetical protein